MGCAAPRRHGRRAAQHLRRGVLRPQPAVRHLLSGRAARRRGDGPGVGRHAVRRRSTASCSTPAASGSTPTCSTASITFRKSAAFRKDQIAPPLVSDMGAENPETARIPAGRRLPARSVDGPVSRRRRRARSRWSIRRKHPQNAASPSGSYNYKRAACTITNRVQRTYVLNDEAALVVCDYGNGKRPEVPFPYFAEAWTGLEYQAAAQLIYRRHGARRRGGFREQPRAATMASAAIPGMKPNAATTTRAPCRPGRGAGAERLPLSRRGEERDDHAAVQCGCRKFSCFWSAAPAWGSSRKPRMADAAA